MSDLCGWAVTKKYANSYVDVCELAIKNEIYFENFKKHPYYTAILEHVPYDLGKKYLEHTKANNPTLFSLLDTFIKKNDNIGNPNKVVYKNYSNLSMSPTTARYVKVLSDIELVFNKSLNEINIVEIGAGYGGLATIINTKYSFKKYYSVDLPAPGKLFKKYCSAVGINNIEHVAPSNLLDYFNDISIDLVISNYAFSECDEETQDFYIKNILSRAKMGYITYNSNQKMIEKTIDKIREYKNFKIYNTDLCKKKHPIFVWGD